MAIVIAREGGIKLLLRAANAPAYPAGLIQPTAVDVYYQFDGLASAPTFAGTFGLGQTIDVPLAADMDRDLIVRTIGRGPLGQLEYPDWRDAPAHVFQTQRETRKPTIGQIGASTNAATLIGVAKTPRIMNVRRITVANDAAFTTNVRVFYQDINRFKAESPVMPMHFQLDRTTPGNDALTVYAKVAHAAQGTPVSKKTTYQPALESLRYSEDSDALAVTFADSTGAGGSTGTFAPYAVGISSYGSGTGVGVSVPVGGGGAGGLSFTDGDKGEIVVSGGGLNWLLKNNVVTNAKLRDSAAFSVIGRAGNSDGDPADIVAAVDFTVLRRTGAAVAFGQLLGPHLALNTVAYERIQKTTDGNVLLGNPTGAVADIQEIPCTAAGRALLDDANAASQRTTLGLGSLATLSTIVTANITDAAVTYAKMQNVSGTPRLLGRYSAVAGPIQEITIGANLALSAGGVLSGTVNAETINITRAPYNAVGDDATDNSAAINAALLTGQNVFIPPGIFRHSATLILKKGQLLFGAGMTSVLKYTGTGIQLQEPEGVLAGETYGHINLADFELTCTAAATIAVELVHNYETTFRNVRINGNGIGYTVAGVNIKATDANYNSAAIELSGNCKIILCVGDGVRVASGISGVAGLWIKQCHIQGNGGYGVRLSVPVGGPYPASSNVDITANLIEGNVLGNIYADVTYSLRITGNHLEHSPAQYNKPHIRLGNVGFAQGVTIESNHIGVVTSAYAIDCTNCADIIGRIQGNSFTGVGTAAIYAPTATGLVVGPNLVADGKPEVAVGVTAKGVLLHNGARLKLFGGASAVQPIIESTGGFLGNQFVASVNGTAAVPAITRESDPNTGLYFAYADAVGISTGGQVRAIFDTVLSLFPSGTGAGQTGAFQLYNLALNGYVNLRAHDTSAAYTLTLPANGGAPDQLLRTDGAGNLTWVTRQAGHGVAYDNINLTARPRFELFGEYGLQARDTGFDTQWRTAGVMTGLRNFVTDANARGFVGTSTGTIAAGSLGTVTLSAGLSWQIGNGIWIAGAAGGNPHFSTVTAIDGTGAVLTINPPATTAVTNAQIRHDDSAALQALIDLRGSIAIPPKFYTLQREIVLRASSEAYSYTIRGGGAHCTHLIVQHGGSCFVAEEGVTLEAFEIHDLSMATSIAGDPYTVVPLTNRGHAIDLTGANVVNYARMTNLRIIGFGRFGIIADNLQGGSIRHCIIRQCGSGGIALIGDQTVWISGKEPNANLIEGNQIDQSPWINVTDTNYTGVASMPANSYLVNISSGAFTADMLGRLVRVINAGVSGGDLVGTVKAVNSATQIKVSCKNVQGVALNGLSLLVEKVNVGDLVFLQSHHNTLVRNICQGNRSNSPQVVHGLRAEGCEGMEIVGQWFENSGGSGGFDFYFKDCQGIDVTGYFSNVQPGTVDNANPAGNFKLVNTFGLTITAATLPNPGLLLDMDINSKRVRFSNCQLPAPEFLFSSFIARPSEVEVDETCVYYNDRVSGSGAMHQGTKILYDALYGENRVVNGSFADSKTGYTDVRPTDWSVVSGAGRYGTYARINTQGLTADVVGLIASQSISIPDSEAPGPYVLAYDMLVENFGIGSETGRSVSIIIVGANGAESYTAFAVGSLNVSNLAANRWQRPQYSLVLGAGVNRSFTIQFLASRGPNTPIVRVANLRLMPGKHAAGSYDQPLTEFAGGTLRSFLRMVGLAAAPAAPPVGSINFYPKTISGVVKLYTQNAAGIETEVGAGSGAGTANYLSKWVTDTTQGASGIIELSGNIGIGTATPTLGKLQIVKASTYNSEATAGIYLLSGTADSSLMIGADAANDLSFIQSLQHGTDFSTRPLILQPNGGNVGIGLINPTAKLHVAGNLLVGSANGRVWGIEGLAAGHTVSLRYGGDSENEIVNTYGAGAIFKSYHGLTIQNANGGVIGPALTVKSLQADKEGLVVTSNIAAGSVVADYFLIKTQAGTALARFNPSGWLGVGLMPAGVLAPIHVRRDDEGTNNIIEVRRIERGSTSATPVAGYGLKELYRLRNPAGSQATIGEMEWAWHNVTAGAEAGRWTVRVPVGAAAGALLPIYEIDAGGRAVMYRYVTAGTGSGQQGAATFIYKSLTVETMDACGPRMLLKVEDVNAATTRFIGSMGATYDHTNNGSTLFFNCRNTAEVGAGGATHQIFQGDWRGNVAVGPLVATNPATMLGCFYIHGGAGPPAVAPVAIAGKTAMYYDQTNNVLYAYSNGVWRVH